MRPRTVWHGHAAICPRCRQRQPLPGAGPGPSPTREGTFAPGRSPLPPSAAFSPPLLLPALLLLAPGWKGLNPILAGTATAWRRESRRPAAHPAALGGASLGHPAVGSPWAPQVTPSEPRGHVLPPRPSGRVPRWVSSPWDVAVPGAVAQTEGTASPSSTLHPGRVPSRGAWRPRWHRAGQPVACGALGGPWGGGAARSGAGAGAGGGSASSPSSCPRPWAPRANLVPIGASCCAGSAASHAINPQTKGPLSPRRSQPGPAPAPALPPRRGGCSPAPQHWDPQPRSPSAALPGPVPAARWLLQLVSISQMCVAAAAPRPRGSPWGPLWGSRAALGPRAPQSTQRVPKPGRVGRRWQRGATGAAAGRSRFLAAWPCARLTAAPGSVSGAPWPGLPLLHGHLLAPGSVSPRWRGDPWVSPASPPQGTGSYQVGAGRRGLDAEQQAVGQAEVAVPVAAEVPAPPHQLVDLQACQANHSRCGGDDGGHDPPGDPLALRTGGGSPAALHRTRTPGLAGCPSHLRPVSRGDAVVLRAQVGRCCDEVHMDVIVLRGRVWGHQNPMGTSRPAPRPTARPRVPSQTGWAP